MSDKRRRESDKNAINKWWHWIRPYWHVVSFIVLITFIGSMNWAKVSAYDGRLVALELWRIEVSGKQAEDHQDIAVIKQDVKDIHEYLIPKSK